jgi:transcription antitermination factor NusG
VEDDLPDSRAWFAVQARTGYENSVCKILSHKGTEVLLPTYKLKRRWSDRIKEVSQVLFPGYVFVHLDPEYRLPVLTTPGVYSIVGIGKAPLAIPDHEIDSIRKMVDSKLPIQPWPFMKVGQRVRIDYGPLSGLEGLLIQVKKSLRVVVSVELVARSVAVEVSSDMVTNCSSWTKPRPHPLSPETAHNAGLASSLQNRLV